MNSIAHEADDIRQQMIVIRTSLGGEVSGLVSNAQQLADWRHYVRTFPWASLGVAAAVGYFAVPRKLEIIRPDPATLEELAKKNRLVVKHQPKGEEKQGLMVSVASFAGHMLLRAGLAYLGQELGRIVGEQSTEPKPREAVQP